MLIQDSFQRSRINGFCPVCDTECGGTLSVGASGWRSVLCIKGNPAKPPTGWKSKAAGEWGLYWPESTEAKVVLQQAFEDSDGPRVSSSQSSNKGFAPVAKACLTQQEINTFVAWLDEYARVTRYPNWCKGYIDLAKRGLSAEQMDALGVYDFNVAALNAVVTEEIKSIIMKLWGHKVVAMLARRGDSQVSCPYYFYCIRDYAGNVKGFQRRYYSEHIESMKLKHAKNPKVKVPAKYTWSGGYVHEGTIWSSYDIDTQALPIQVLHAAKPCRTLLLTEGTIKPYLIHQRLNADYHVMGAAGGNFLSSEAAFMSAVAAFECEKGVNQIVFLADAGSYELKETNEEGAEPEYKRPNVVSAIERIKVFCEESGIPFTVADWGQLNTKEGQADCDEVDPETVRAALPLEISSSKEAFQKSFSVAMSNKNRININYKSCEVKHHKEVVLNDGEDATKYYTQAKYVLNRTSMGRGKTNTVTDIVPAEGTAQVIYLPLSARNPATESVERIMPQLGRVSGLVETGSISPLGEKVTRRAKAGEEAQHSGNCAHADLIASVESHGGCASSICSGCSFRPECMAGTHPQYNYLNQRIRAKSEGFIRTSIQALNPEEVDESSHLVVDEVTQAANFLTDFAIRIESVRFYLDRISSLLTKGSFTVDCNCKPTFTDCTAEEVLLAAATIDAELTAKIQQQLAMKKKPSGIPAHCVEWLQHVFNPTVIWGKNSFGTEYTTQVRDLHILDVIQRAGRVTFLDATVEPEVLAAMFNIPIEELLVIRDFDKATDNVTVKVEVTDYFNSRGQSIEEKKALMKEIRKSMRSRYQKVGFLTHKEFTEEGDCCFFNESRGSNKFKEMDAITIMGLPQIDLGAARRQWEVLKHQLGAYGWSFDDYYQYLTHCELKQCIGRIRGYHREEPLAVYIFANVSLPKLEAEGYNVIYEVAALAGYTTHMSPHVEKALNIFNAAGKCLEEQRKLTQAALADIMQTTKQSISQGLKKLNWTMDTLAGFFANVPQPGSWFRLPEVFKELVEQVDDDDLETLKVFEGLGVDQARYALEVISRGFWPAGFKRHQLRKLMLGLAYRLRDLVNLESLGLTNIYGEFIDAEWQRKEEENRAWLEQKNKQFRANCYGYS